MRRIDERKGIDIGDVVGREGGCGANDLFERLAADAEFPASLDDLRDVESPATFHGRAPEQVDEFLAEVVAPILEREPVVARETTETPLV